jgi:hypothetical protein
MDTKQQSKITEQNKNTFFQKIYHHQNNSKEQLINLDELRESTIIIIDCCGWHYKKLFPYKSIIALETFWTVKNFELDSTYFDQLFHFQSSAYVNWPSVPTDECAVVLDRSPLLRYQTTEQLSCILHSIKNKYSPDCIAIEQMLIDIDDSRLVDRFYNIAKLKIDNYLVDQFNYNTNTMRVSIRFRKKVNLHKTDVLTG